MLPSLAVEVNQLICRNFTDVARWRLCVGCGACASACERQSITLEDVPGAGIRPIVRGVGCDECGKCIEVCPGLGMTHNFRNISGPLLTQLQNDWGPILEIWEGYAADPEIRNHGSSGGAATAIALYCLEAGIAGGALHVGKNEEEPWRNKTVISRSRQDLLSQTGSRYCPASPCDGLAAIESAPSPLVFVGKPCDIQGLRKTESLKPLLREKVALALGIFCAGTPTTLGLTDLLASLNVSKEEVRDIRFRGNGWPGSFSVLLKDGAECSQKLSYQESWGFLQKYRPFRCYLCPDGTSEFADISCGDAWYREPAGDDPGQSLVLVRTERGRQIIDGAVEAGYLRLSRVEPEVVELSQKNLLLKRSAIWGRLLAMTAFGLPVPRFEGFPLFENWLQLSSKEKARSILGTAKRIIKRKYNKPLSGC